MKPKQMYGLAHKGCHECAPKAWHDIPYLTGDYDFDATVLHRGNGDMPDRLKLYTKTQSTAYGHHTGYSGYKNYSGDD